MVTGVSLLDTGGVFTRFRNRTVKRGFAKHARQ